jgi:hypothetical protein
VVEERQIAVIAARASRRMGYRSFLEASLDRPTAHHD